MYERGNSMKQKIQIIIPLVLAICMCGGLTSHAFARDVVEAELVQNQIEPRFAHLMSVAPTITINANTGKITCGLVANSRVSTDTLEGTVYLQKLTNNTWNSIKSWSFEGTFTVDVSKSYYTAQSGTYRTLAVIEVYDASGRLIEEVTEESYERTYSAP